MQFDLCRSARSQLGGLPTPAHPAERIEDRVMTKDGRDVTAEYRHGAEQALHLARLCGCKIALLKERSPSCGSGTIYDGTFTGGLTAGDGVTAALLRENGITVYGESEIGRLLEEHGQPMEAMVLKIKNLRTGRFARFFEVRPCGRTRSPPASGTSTCRRGYCCARSNPARRI